MIKIPIRFDDIKTLDTDTHTKQCIDVSKVIEMEFFSEKGMPDFEFWKSAHVGQSLDIQYGDQHGDHAGPGHFLALSISYPTPDRIEGHFRLYVTPIPDAPIWDAPVEIQTPIGSIEPMDSDLEDTLRVNTQKLIQKI